jgi:hypothetical protein
MIQITVYLKVPSQAGGVEQVNIQLRGNFKWSIDEKGALEIEPDEKEIAKRYVFNWDHVLYFNYTETE